MEGILSTSLVLFRTHQQKSKLQQPGATLRASTNRLFRQSFCPLSSPITGRARVQFGKGRKKKQFQKLHANSRSYTNNDNKVEDCLNSNGSLGMLGERSGRVDDGGRGRGMVKEKHFRTTHHPNGAFIRDRVACPVEKPEKRPR